MVYVSASYDVVAAHIDPITGQPAFYNLITLPSPATLRPTLYPEYPAVHTISGNVLAISDGSGQIHVVEVEAPHASGSGLLLGSYKLSTGDEDNILPFRMHHVRIDTGDEVHCIISVSTRVTTPAPSSTKGGSTEKTSYRLMSVSFKISKQPLPGVQLLTVDWAITGDSLPLLFLHDPDAQRYILASSTPLGALPSHPPPDPQADEIAPIPRPDENMNDVPAIRDLKPPPYSWTQTNDSVTVVFPLPSTTPKASIRVLFSAQNLTLLVSDRDTRTAFPFPVYVRKLFWDGIHSDTSYWTWDRAGDKPGSSIGLLSLHLDKQHEGTRWIHVFAAAGTATAEEEDVDVPEMVDPSELANIREQLEKWTTQFGDDNLSGSGIGRNVPSLLDGEMDEDGDDQVGRRVVFSYVTEGGQVVCPAPHAPVDLLSVPFPHTGANVVVKHTLDGLFFAAPTSTSPEEPSLEWKHAATYPALAFVLASKRDVKFTFHHGPNIVLAFEGGTGKGLSIGGNVYMYEGADGQRTSGQAVLRVSGGESGPLMGVQLVEVGGKTALVCLCEKALVVVRDILGW
ncbi:hypothetical protein DACRYDRAFT_65273 [Dacryopinax primogenitus]|uniref:NudC domain-containing protein 1 n=1 Tax=Dacryopinax primogenitus (strain DJM 731) TaxID=1858805 RepID=M5FYI0_DACPD|nr:uncharacterized protein DACRYDRAFT_65273 [Dacryopinax primogenitus]EJU03101.1 hypothetical protein DACRYDRAFT_65273 [Dacryopinax primogenitus]